MESQGISNVFTLHSENNKYVKQNAFKTNILPRDGT